MNYPRKSRKTTVKEATSVVCILYSCEKSDARKYLLFQRPKTGLLAGLLEFPILDAETVKEESLNVKVITKRLKSRLGVGKKVTKVQEAGSYLHKFSHLKQTYLIWSAQVEGMDALKDVPFDEEKHQRSEVLSEDEIMKSAISTAMKNVFQVFSKKPTMVRMVITL